MARSQFTYAMAAFLQQHPEMLAFTSFEPTPFSNASTPEVPRWRLRHLAAVFPIRIRVESSHGRAVYDQWQALLSRLNDVAPPTAKHARQTSPVKLLWLHMALHEIYLSMASTVVLWSIVVGFCFILIATHSVRIASLSAIALATMLGAWLGMSVMCGFFANGMGAIEVLVLTIAAGVTLDPLVHVAFAFSEASGTAEQRLCHAVTTIGISVLAAGVSTSGSCSITIFTTIVLFSRFGKLICSLVAASLIYSNFFLAPLLLLYGKEQEQSTPVMTLSLQAHAQAWHAVRGKDVAPPAD